jgi:hypothetical protein
MGREPLGTHLHFFRARRSSLQRQISQPRQTSVVKISAGICMDAGFRPMPVTGGNGSLSHAVTVPNLRND